MIEEVVSAEKKDAGRIVEHFHECGSLGVELLPPDVNFSEMSCSFERENVLRLGFSALKCKDLRVLDDLLFERRKNGQFQDFQDFCERIDIDKAPESFFLQSIKAGMFDSIGESRAQLFEGVELIIQAVRNAKAEKAANQISLFAVLPAESQEVALSLTLPEVEAWSEEQKIDYEKEALGFSFTEYSLQREEEQAEAPAEKETVEQKLNSSPPSHEEITAPSDRNKMEENKDDSLDSLEALDSSPPVESVQKSGEEETSANEPSQEIAGTNEAAPDYLNEPPLPSEEHLGTEESSHRESIETPHPDDSPDKSANNSEVHVIVIQVSVRDVTEAQLVRLRALCEKYPGQNPFVLEFIDETQQVKIRVRAGRNYYVRNDEELREEIRSLLKEAYVEKQNG